MGNRLSHVWCHSLLLECSGLFSLSLSQPCFSFRAQLKSYPWKPAQSAPGLNFCPTRKSLLLTCSIWVSLVSSSRSWALWEQESCFKLLVYSPLAWCRAHKKWTSNFLITVIAFPHVNPIWVTVTLIRLGVIIPVLQRDLLQGGHYWKGKREFKILSLFYFWKFSQFISRYDIFEFDFCDQHCAIGNVKEG